MQCQESENEKKMKEKDLILHYDVLPLAFRARGNRKTSTDQINFTDIFRSMLSRARTMQLISQGPSLHFISTHHMLTKSVQI